jgi:predicted lipoprotein with Yx(FWY)xxD motif
MPGRRIASLAVLCSLVVLVAVSAASADRQAAATVKLGHTQLGSVLVDGKGRTLYLFVEDSPKTISCAGATCARIWPPLLTSGTPQAGPGVKASLLGTVHRTRPTGVQVTYAGHPLYYYDHDAKPGDVKGQGYYSLWYAVSASGKSNKKPYTP